MEHTRLGANGGSRARASLRIFLNKILRLNSLANIKHTINPQLLSLRSLPGISFERARARSHRILKSPKITLYPLHHGHTTSSSRYGYVNVRADKYHIYILFCTRSSQRWQTADLVPVPTPEEALHTMDRHA